jgi:hypothetical protein
MSPFISSKNRSEYGHCSVISQIIVGYEHLKEHFSPTIQWYNARLVILRSRGSNLVTGNGRQKMTKKMFSKPFTPRPTLIFVM